MNEDGHSVRIPTPTLTELVEPLSSCAFLCFDPTIAPATVYEECLESRFALKAGVAIPDMVRSNAIAPPMTDDRQLLQVKDLLVAIQVYPGASPNVGGINLAGIFAQGLDNMRP